MAERSIGRTIGGLALALLNATLILVALCLWLTWGVLSSAERVSAEIGETADVVLPLREEVRALTAEIAGARADLAALRAEADQTLSSGGAARIADQIEAVDRSIAELTSVLSRIATQSGPVIDEAIAASFDELRSIVLDAVALWRGSGAEADVGG